MSDTRKKLIELICDGTLKTEICTTDTHLECETCKGDCGYCTILADHLIANGVRLETKQVTKQATSDKECKYCLDEFCVNDQCPMCADYCPVVDYPGVCRYEDRERNEP